MDNAIFFMRVFNTNLDYDGPDALIELPTDEYEIEEALLEVRAEGNDDVMAGLERSSKFNFLSPYVDEAENLRALNALSGKLAGLEPMQVDALEGLVRMDKKNGVVITVPRLYDLASSVDDCQVLYDVHSYEALGRFFAENDFVPEVEDVDDKVWELLDFDKIGRREAERENGAFIGDDRAFVVLTGDIHEKFRNLDLSPKTPDYAALLKVGKMDTGESVELKLPCEHKDLDDVLTSLHADSWSDLTWRCAGCRIPSLRDAFSQADDIVFANHAAGRIEDIEGDELLAYKFLLSAKSVSDLATAMDCLDSMGSYVFTRDYTGAEAVARGELELISDAEALMPFVDLWRYGRKLIEERNISITPYGTIERKDHEPILASRSDQVAEGMEMKMKMS